MSKSKKKTKDITNSSEKSNVNNLKAICAEAKRLGMSYGKYVSMTDKKG